MHLRAFLQIFTIFGHCYLTYLVLRPEYSRLAWSIKWLLIFCFLQSPGHQQLIYWYSNGFFGDECILDSQGRIQIYLHIAKDWDCETVGTMKWSKYIRKVETVKQLGPWNGLSIFKRWRLWNSQAREAVLTLMALWWLCIPGNFYILS